MSMFCFQCEQTAKGTGCTVTGACGKDPQTASLQDLLVHVAEGIAVYAHRARRLGVRDRGLDLFVVEALFTTVTNVNFDPQSVEQWVRRGAELIGRARALYEQAALQAGQKPERLVGGPSNWAPAGDSAGLLRQAEAIGIARRLQAHGQDVAGLQELIMYGLKGMAAYADHAQVLAVEKEEVYGFFHEALDFLAGEPSELQPLVEMALRVGQVNLEVMGMLDAANTGAYGHPTPTKVRVTPLRGKAILVSGHDLRDLADLLEQTAGKGIKVYTHGEMLPCHGYPELKKHPHLAGNYGGAWQDQRKEFEAFPGAILMTTNCIQQPRESYQGRIFTSGLVQWPGVRHIAGRDFTPVIEAALAAPGFAEDGEPQEILVGFGHNAVLGAADQVIDLVKRGKIRRFFLVGGCDGAKSGRNYYTDLAQQIPDDCVILTLACGKFRFNKLEFGAIEGLPRLLDLGQCNDAFSAVKVAQALAGAFGVGVNELPLSLVLSWYEQKAVCILLTLLHLGIRDIRLGPSLPAFVGPNVFQVLIENFNLMPISTPQADLQAILG